MHPNEIVLHDYVDAALGGNERAEVERHLTTCAQCRQTVDDLRELARRIASLPPMEPPARAWRRIERDLNREAARGTSLRGEGGARAPRRAWLFGLAAAAVLVLAVLAGVRYGGWRRSPAAPTAAPDAQSIASELTLAEEHYQKAINGLEQIANAEKGELDPRTAATLQKNLAVIDQAISESRAALKAQPNSESAQQSLIESFKSKIALLQDTVALINEMRKGNDAGAARILKEKS